MPEVVVVGGGIVGLAAAWSLRRAGAGSVTLLEKGSCGQGSTAKATGGARVQFGSGVNVRISLVSLRYFLDWSEIHSGDVGYRPIGYLFLATSPEHLEAQALGAEVQRSCGASVELMAPGEIASMGPGMEVLHGFMHAPAVGEKLARLVLGRPTEVNVAPLSPSRFGAGLEVESYVF